MPREGKRNRSDRNEKTEEYCQMEIDGEVEDRAEEEKIGPEERRE